MFSVQQLPQFPLGLPFSWHFHQLLAPDEHREALQVCLMYLLLVRDFIQLPGYPGPDSLLVAEQRKVYYAAPVVSLRLFLFYGGTTGKP